MPYKCWRHKLATNTLQGLDCAQLSCEYHSENRVVTSNLRHASNSHHLHSQELWTGLKATIFTQKTEPPIIDSMGGFCLGRQFANPSTLFISPRWKLGESEPRKRDYLLQGKRLLAGGKGQLMWVGRPNIRLTLDKDALSTAFCSTIGFAQYNL